MVVRRLNVTKPLEFPAGPPKTLAIIDGYDDIPVFHRNSRSASSFKLLRRLQGKAICSDWIGSFALISVKTAELSSACPAFKMRAATTRMKVIFLGTRGGIKLRSGRHRYHSALLIEHGGTRVMIDCGADWLGKIPRIAPVAILLTHAHPDHAAGLAKGAPCCVCAPPKTLSLLRRYPIAEWRKMLPGRVTTIGGLKF
jgi:hypothetical protein